jgi:hypothetical protein
LIDHQKLESGVNYDLSGTIRKQLGFGIFEGVFDTNQAGSAANQLDLPFSFADNATIDWDDGNSDPVSVGTVSHVYAAPGTYNVKISGDGFIFNFNDLGDKAKLLNVINWGICIIGEDGFDGCLNCTFATATDVPRLDANIDSAFRKTSSMIGNSSFNDWDFSTVNDMTLAFALSSFNQYIGDVDVSNVTKMPFLFRESDYDQPLTNWDTSNVIEWKDFMYNHNTGYSHDLSFLSFASCQTLERAFSGSGLSTANYDALLISWDAQTIPLVNFNVGVSGLTYTLGGAAETARTNLIGKGWVFIGDSGI